jgi:murein DD-endopeptidase MepM/ murein hydrolase activator NlpD
MAIISPIETSANNIVKIGLRSSNSLPRARNEFNQFLNFLDVRKIELEKTKLPEERKIKELSNIDLVSTFGSAGGLLSSLLGGGLDLAGLVRGMFSEKGKKVGGPSPTRPQKPKVSGNKLKIGGLRAIGITNAIFAGLDFATGLQEGESVGKAAAGAGGSLAGSLLGGAIGQALIPIPGVGFVLGSMAGGFLGGWTGDRVYESVSGEGGGSSTEERTGERLKEQEERQKKAIRKGDGGFEEILMKFSNTVDKFENFAMNFGQIMGVNEDTPYDEPSEYPDFPEDSGEPYDGPVDGDTFFPLPGGDVGTHGRVGPGQAFGASRDGGTRSHAGLDMTHWKGALDAPVAAYKSGKVVWASPSGSYNSGVMVDHGNGLKTKYFHVTPLVNTGDIVYGGQQIAKLFPAGVQTHLHFEIHKNGTPVDPMTNGVIQSTRLPAALSKNKAKEHSGTNNVTGSEVERKKMGTDLYMPQQTESEVQSRSQDSTQSFRNLTSSAGMPSQVSMMQSLPQSVMAASPRQVPQIQSYPSYSQGQSYIIERPIMMMSNTPSVNPSGSNIAMVPTSNGGSSSSGPNMGQIVNSLVKSMLLTNLSSS